MIMRRIAIATTPWLPVASRAVMLVLISCVPANAALNSVLIYGHLGAPPHCAAGEDGGDGRTLPRQLSRPVRRLARRRDP